MQKINHHGWPLSAYVLINKKVGQVTGGDQCYVFVTFHGNQERAFMPNQLKPYFPTTK